MDDSSQNGGRKESPKNKNPSPAEIDESDKNYRIFKQAMLDSISESDLSILDYLGSEKHDLVLK